MTDELKTRRARRRSAAPSTPDAVEIAMEVASTGHAPSEAALDVLRTNAALARVQIGLSLNEHFRNRIKAVRDGALAAAAVLLIAAVAATLWNANRASGLVIQPFSVPPVMVEAGLDGTAVAALFQDELTRLEAATDSSRAPSSFRNDWSNHITIEAEAGGVSLDEAYRALTRWLGNETYISGGLSRTTGGLSLVARTNNGIVVQVTGPADQLPELVRQAAEQVYEKTQPYRFAIFLTGASMSLPDGPERQQHYDRQTAILQTLVSSPSPTERVWAYNGLATFNYRTTREALPFLEAALAIDPQHSLLLGNLYLSQRRLGHDEEALRVGRRNVATAAHNLWKLNPAYRAQLMPIYRSRAAGAEGDWKQALEQLTLAQNKVPNNLGGLSNTLARADALIELHEPSSALRNLRALDLNSASELAIAIPYVDLPLPYEEAASDLERWPAAAASLEAVEASYAPNLIPRFAAARQTYLWPKLAYARARIGDIAGAQALIAATPLDCYLCIRERARIAELAGDRVTADHWSAEARRLGPSLPFAFSERGQMLMARGDAEGATGFYEEAVRRGPGWADPRKFWGDALMAKGDAGGAIRKYREAAERAPRWGALYLAWGRALSSTGRADEAAVKYRAAASMDLSATDQAEVARRLAAVSSRP